MEFKGTKGKWVVSNTHPNETIVDVNCGDLGGEDWAVIVCYNAKDGSTQIANALLISKAPEMLELLKEALDTFQCNDSLDRELKSKIEQLIKEATEL